MHAPGPTFAPSQPSRGSSVVKFLVLGFVCLFFVLPILAVFALTLLGSTVESEFTEIPSPSAASPTAEPVPLEPVLNDEVVGEAFFSEQGDFSFSSANTWAGPSVTEVDGRAVTTWSVPEFESATVSVWTRDNPNDISVEDIVRFETAELGFIFDEYQSAIVEGQPTAVSLYSPDGSVGVWLVVHESASGYAVSMTSVPIENLVSLVLEYVDQLNSIRYTG